MVGKIYEENKKFFKFDKIFNDFTVNNKIQYSQKIKKLLTLFDDAQT